MEHPFDLAEAQIRAKKKEVDYDVKEFTVELMVHKFKHQQLYAPDYRKDFLWSPEKQAKFMESVILGIPIAPIFVVDTAKVGDKGSKWEIIDGIQRIYTLTRFVDNLLIIKDLQLLTMLNDKTFADMSGPRQRRLLDTSLKFIVFSKKSDLQIRMELFQRINSSRTL